TGVPLAGGATGNSKCLYLPVNRSMKIDLDLPNLRQPEFIAIDAEPGLREGEAVVSCASAEAGESGFTVALFHPAKESQESLVQSPQHVLQHLRVNPFEFWPCLFDFGQLVLLVLIADRLSTGFVSIAAFFKGGIIKLTA